MTSEELMRLSAEKALRELSWESIEFLFRPANGVELLLRLDFEGMRRKILDWCMDDSPDAMPYRFRPPHVAELLGAIEREEFYREMDRQRNAAGREPNAQDRTDDNLRNVFG